MSRPKTFFERVAAAIVATGLVVAIAAGCGHPRRVAAPAAALVPAIDGTVRVRTLPTPERFEDLLGLADGELDPVWAALLAEVPCQPGYNPRASLAVADRLAESIAPHIDRAEPLEAKARQVSAGVFGVARFRTPSQGQVFSPAGSLVPFREMLASHEGDCFGLSLLYLGVCRRLGIPARMSLVPFHAFVTLDDGVSRVHVETTAGGELVDIRKLLEPLGLGSARVRELGDKSTLAVICLQVGVKRAARTHLAEVLDGAERALAIDPNLAEAWGQCGMVALRRGDALRAEQCLSKAIGLEPGYPSFWFARGAAYAEEGRADAAAAMYARGLQQAIRIPLIWEKGGWFLFEQRQYPPAVRCFDRALKLERGRPRSLEGRGVALAALGEYAAARRALQRAISREPENQRLKDELARVVETDKLHPRPSSSAPPKKP